MNAESDLETHGEPFEIAAVEEDIGASRRVTEGAEYPFYIVPRPPVPGKTVWSIASW